MVGKKNTKKETEKKAEKITRKKTEKKQKRTKIDKKTKTKNSKTKQQKIKITKNTKESKNNEKEKQTEKKIKKNINSDSNQPEVNIGLIGHVDHGKTTLTKMLSGKWTDTHSEELKRGITIRLGYANATFYKCTKCGAYGTKPICEKCGGPAKLERTISLIDAPGHESLMATMIAGATIIDGAILLVAANEKVPQPQTKEHLMALNIMGIKKLIVVQNKIDTVTKEEAKKNYEYIKRFLKGSIYENAPIIPISAQHKVNIDLVIEAIEKFIPTPERDENADPIMFSARSFDINKPGSDPINMKGGIIGGALKKGTIKIGDKIELKPGIKIGEKWTPIKTKVVKIMSGKTEIKKATPGGSIALMTTLDPAIAKSDNLVGNVVGHEGKLPPTWEKLKLEVHLLKRVVGMEHGEEVEDLKPNEMLMMNINSAATVGLINHIGKNKTIECTLRLPICADAGQRVTLARRIGARWRLIGYGIIKE